MLWESLLFLYNEQRVYGWVYGRGLAGIGLVYRFSSREMVFPKLVVVDGNIGAGKSTVLKGIKALHPEFYCVSEPLDLFTKFTKLDGGVINPLDVFYEDASNCNSHTIVFFGCIS